MPVMGICVSAFVGVNSPPAIGPRKIRQNFVGDVAGWTADANAAAGRGGFCRGVRDVANPPRHCVALPSKGGEFRTRNGHMCIRVPRCEFPARGGVDR